MMLQPYDIQESEISCDTTSVLTTPFSVKDILNMNINNDSNYCISGIKKEPYEMHPQFWDNTVFPTNECQYYCNNVGDNRHYWSSDSVYCDTYSQQYHPNIQQVESPVRTPVQADGCIPTESPSKFTYVKIFFYFKTL